MRIVALAAALLSLPACVLTSGADCAGACDKLVACTSLHGTFRLSCSPLPAACFDDVATCADCIEAHACNELVSGACDATCRVAGDAGP